MELKKMKPLPKESGMDHTMSMIREGYQFIPNRRLSFQSDVFETRLLGEPVICLSGEKGAELFYDNSKFVRKGAAPKRAQKTLLGERGVQTLDGEAHRKRKAAFMSLMGPSQMQQLTELTQYYWEKRLTSWEQQKEVSLYEEAQDLLLRIACHWAGVPLKEEEVEEKRKAVAQLFESPARVGLKHRRGRKARAELEKWIGHLIETVREGELIPFYGTALHVFSHHRDVDGKLLDERVAAVEVLNIIRPIVAISVYIAFLGHAIIQYPEERQKLAARDEKTLRYFVQEVRRFYPFFPFNGARVKEDFEWNGCQFTKGTLVLLDFYGTNHDPEIWENPNVFDPGRFHQQPINAFNHIPQGGGDYYTNHRCPGEWVTLEVMQVSLDYLANRMLFEVPEQDLSYSLVDIPSIPNSEVILRNVRRKHV